MVDNVREVKKKDKKEYLAEYYRTHKAERKVRDAKYRKNHKAEIKIKKAEYRKTHKDERKEYNKKNKDKIKLQTAENYQKHKAERKLKRAEYNEKNKDKIKLQSAERYQKNKDKIKEFNKDHKNEINNKANTKRRNRKIELIQLMGNKCRGDNCNIEYDGTNTSLFQFHHINPKTKLFELGNSNLLNHSRNKILEEANKCKLLCANCHSLEHSIKEPKNLTIIKKRNIKVKLIQLIGNKCQGDNCNIEYDGTNTTLFQFHHIDPKTKLFQLSRSNLIAHSWDELLDEAKKCKLLCANCHKQIHSRDY